MDDSGQAILEFAVMLPVFCLIGFGMVDLVWLTKDAANLDYIVNESARCEAIMAGPCTTPSATNQYAHDQAENLRLSAANLTIATPPCTTTCTVTMTYRYHALGVWFPAITMNRTGTAAYVPPPVP